MKNAENPETPVDTNNSESVYTAMKKKFNKILAILERKKFLYEICVIFGVIAIVLLLWCLGCGDYIFYSEYSIVQKTPIKAKFLDTSEQLPTLISYETNMDTKWERFKQEYYDSLLDDSKDRLKRDAPNIPETINEVDVEIAYHAQKGKQITDVKTKFNDCKSRWKSCTKIINLINSKAKTASDAIESLKQMIETIKPNSENPSIEELYECLVCENVTKTDIKMDDRGSSGSRPYKSSRGSERLRGQNVNHVVNVYTNDKQNEGIPVELPTSNGNIQRAILITKSNTSKIQDGAKITQVIKNRTIIERSKDSDEPVKVYIPFMKHQLSNGKSIYNIYNPDDYSNKMTTRDTSSYNDQRRKEIIRNNFNSNNPPIYQQQQQIQLSSKHLNGMHMSQLEPSSPSSPSNLGVIPTAENTQSSQQLRLTPVVPLIPYPLCYYGGMAPAQVPIKPEQILFPSETGNRYLPPVTGFTNPTAPSPFGNTDFNQQPLTGLFQPSAYSPGYPIIPPQALPNYFGDQRVGPTGPGSLFPGYGYPRSSSPPVYPCPYITMPTYQFPLVPGISDLQRMDDFPMSFRNNLGQPLDQPSFRGSTWRESSNSSAHDSQLECKPNYFKCLDNSRCIPIFQRCDGNVDCIDVSDESSCSCKDRITQDKLCDGYFDCPKGEDELGCFGCGNNSFSCQDWTKRNPHGSCVQLSERCDGVQHCPNSKDETDCSILTQSFIENQDLFTVGYSSGYLFKNWRGKWYPVCSPTMAWAIESCASEVGTSSKRTPIVTVESIVQGHPQDSYLTMKPSGQIEIVPECSDKVVFVKCPPIPCGTRILVKEKPFKPHGVYEDTLVASQQTENVTLNATSNNSNISDVIHPTKADGRNMNSRITGGRASEPQAWPFLVAIYRDGYFKCGGVIVSEQWILTAAHCVEGHQDHFYQIFAGLLRRFSFSPMAQIRQAKSIIPHHTYKNVNMRDDLALIQLNEGLRFNRWIRASCLPQPQWGNQPTAGDKCTAIGWGAIEEHGPDPDHLRDVEVPVLAKCKRSNDHYEGIVCAGLPDGGKDACQGDSGGPLMCKVQNTDTQWYVAGVISHGVGCGLPDEPGAYTRVSHYFHWINDTIHRDHAPLGSETLSDCPGFKCSGRHGKCLPRTRRCDKNVDCLDAEDELNCDNVPTVFFFRGSSNEPVNENPESSDNVQNQMNDLQSAHGSEGDDVMKIGDQESMTPRFIEAITETTELTEAITERSEISVTPQTIDTTQSYLDDPDDSDEPLRFVCSQLKQTIPITERCNKVIECEDGTDEAKCSCRDFLVKLHPSSICDGRIDCADESDEIDCYICEEDEFTCVQSGTCIPRDKRCDRINDCPLKEDESDCYALTDGTHVEIDANRYSALKDSGIVTNITNQQWKPICYDIHNDNLKNKNYLDSYCQHLGFREHKTYNLRQVKHSPLKVESKRLYANEFGDESALQITNSETSGEELCYGLNIQCEQVFNHNVETFAIKNPVYQNETYLWPWEVAIFVDGHYHCPAILLNYNWALSSSRCTKDIDLRINYTIVLAGLSLPYKFVDGPDQHITQVENIQKLDQLELAILRIGLKQISRYVQPIFFDRKFYPATLNDECVALGTDTKLNTKMTFLQTVLENCPPCHRCFKNKVIEECPKNETTGDWSGTVTCRGPNGWYPAAIFHEKDIFCEYHTVQSLTSIDYMYALLMESTGERYIPVNPPSCNGKRCSLGNCVTWDRVCDGIQDCRDGTDESIMACNEKQNICEYSNNVTCGCAVSEMRCKNGMCIPKNKYCNKYADCPDGSDEPAECNCATYLELTHPERLCDNIRNCYDKTDENPEMCFCTDVSFKCLNSLNLDGDPFCISQEFVCDGERDCPNGEDEIHCRGVRGALKDPPGTGEILRRSYGAWYSECFPAPIKTDSEANDLCLSMGYSNGTLLNSPNSEIYPGSRLERENFYIVVFNEHMFISLRDNKPLVNIVLGSENCHRAFVKCF